MTSSGTFTTLTAASISGTVVASNTEVGSATITNKVVTPSSLAYLLARPPTLGSSTANKATFTDLTASTLAGPVLGTTSEVLAGTTNKVVSTKLLKDSFDSTLPIGSVAPNKATFTNVIINGTFSLKGDTLQASEGGTGFTSFAKGDIVVGNGTTLSKLTVGTSGQVLQSDSTATNGVKWVTISNPLATTAGPGIVTLTNNTDVTSLASTTTANTPAYLKAVLSSPPIIGNTAANNAVFKTITATGLAGSVLATGPTLTSTTQAITPAGLKVMLENPGTIIGNTTQNSAKFTTVTAQTINTTTLSVTNPPWQNIQFATNTEANAGTISTKAVTPTNLANLFANPLPLGTTSANTAKFSNVTITGTLSVTTPPWVSVTYAANTDVTAASAANKALTPANITTLFGSPKPIGTTTPSTGTFTKLTVNGNIVGTLGSTTEKNTATVTTLTADGIAGGVVATTTDLAGATSNTKVIPPSLLTPIFASPKPIGLTTPSTGTFTDLRANTLSGTVVASDAEVKGGIITNKVITPKGLITYLSSTSSSGGSSSSGSTFSSITTGSITGNVIADATTIQLGISNNQVVTPAGLKNYIASPGIVGATSANSANFTTINFETIEGPVIADTDTIFAGNSIDSLITPDGLKTLLQNPYDIGSITPANGFFKTLTAEKVSGNIIATLNDAISGTVNNKVLVPSILRSYLASPPAIGNYIPGTAKFTTLTIDEIAGNVIATADEITTGLSNQKLVTPLTLNTFFDNPRSATFLDLTSNSLNVNNTQDSTSSTTGAITIAGGIGVSKNAFIGGNTSIGGTLTLTTPLNQNNGGTGYSSYNSGDILYADANTDLKTLPIATKAGQVLTATNGLPSWQPLPSSVNTFQILGTNSSNDTLTGALIVNGGVGIAGSVNIGDTLRIATPLEINSGGTGIDSYTPGDLLYADQSGKLAKLPAGDDAQILSLRYGLPIWKDAPTTSNDFTTNTLSATSTNDSTSTTTGAITTYGGVGISKNLNVGGSVSVNTDLHVNGSVGRGKRTVVTASYTILESDYILGVRTSDAITLTLPLISGLTYNDKLYIIKAEIGSPNILLQANTTDLIDGQSNLSITGAYNSVSLYTDGVSEWFIY